MSSTLLATVRRTLLKDMLNSVPGEWKVLIMDSLTTRIMSSACKMSDILEEGVSLVEDVCKVKNPAPFPPLSRSAIRFRSIRVSLASPSRHVDSLALLPFCCLPLSTLLSPFPSSGHTGSAADA